MNDFIGFCKLEQILYVLSLGGQSEGKIQPLVGCIFSEDTATKAQLYVLVCSSVPCDWTLYRKKYNPIKKKYKSHFKVEF